MHSILSSAISHKPRHWQLPVQACHTVGGNIEQAIPGIAALACLHISIILIDDMLDQDPRGEHQRIGRAATANISAAFAATGLESIVKSETKLDRKFNALSDLIQMFSATAFGQYLDVKIPTDEASYWRIVDTKSSPFFGSALYVGAIFGGASYEIATQIKQFGVLYGAMIQIHDDLNDVLEVPANPDWVLGRLPLPILYAKFVQHPEQERFLELRQAITDPKALLEAQSILIRCGAISYAVDQLITRYHIAHDLLNSIPNIRREILENALDGIVAPIRHLLISIGIEQPDILLDC